MSDITLSTMELGLDAKLSDALSAGVSLLWEEDDTEPVDLDVAIIKYGGNEQVPYWIEAGRMYVPFGVFDSQMVSDPLVLELGETRNSAVSAGYNNDLVDVRFAAFNGDMDEATDDDVVDTFVAAASISPGEALSFGIYWMSDLGESDGLEEALSDSLAGHDEYVGVADGAPVVMPGRVGVPYDEVAGAGAFVSLGVDPVTVYMEYLGALDEFAPGLLAETAVKPQAWNVEAWLTVTDTWEVAARYEGSDEYPGMPDTQCGICIAHALMERCQLACEFMHGEFDDGTEDRDMVTVQLAAEF